MKRSPIPGVDLTVYINAVPLLVRNPSIIVVPLLTLVIGVLMRLVLAPAGGGAIAQATSGLGAFILFLLALFGLGAACVVADDAWRHGRASFDTAWTEARRRGGEILTASLGVAILITVGQYLETLIGILGLVVTAVIALFLIWALPAAAIGGVPGGAAIQASIDRVRSAPLAAALATIVTLALVFYASTALGLLLYSLIPLAWSSPIVEWLLIALFQSIAIGYVALIVTKTYADVAFGRRW
jgi:hypothetical protein